MKNTSIRVDLATSLAFFLLGVQVLVPWLVPQLVTLDGPSHLYTATVVHSLLGHQLFGWTSNYSAAYSFNPRLVPNWGGVLLLDLASHLAGVRHAEQLTISLAILFGFFSLSYTIRQLAPDHPQWTPLTNFVLQTWFLWIGFYSFYLGTILSPLLVVYFLRVRARLAIRHAFVLAMGLLGLYSIHLMAALTAGVLLGLLSAWTYWAADRRKFILIFLSFLPTIAAFLAYRSSEVLVYTPEIRWALDNFPMHVFATGAGRAGGQALLWPAILCFSGLALLSLRKDEWRGVPGAWVASALVFLASYFLIPDQGFGGTMVKIRFSWVFFVLSVMLIATVPKLRELRIPLAVYVTIFLLMNFYATFDGARMTSRALQEYFDVALHIPQGSTFVRLRYPTPNLATRYGFDGIGRDPLFHADSLFAAECGCIDLSDYQAAANIFPIVYRSTINDGQRFNLWGFEGANKGSAASLTWLRQTLPIPIQYVLIVADQDSSQLVPELADTLATLNTDMKLISSNSFVRLYGPK